MASPSRASKIAVVIATAAAVFGAGEALARDLVLSQGPVRSVLDAQERLHADFRFGTAPPLPPVALIGTSLAGGERTSLALEIDRLAGGGWVLNHSEPGVIGDVIGRALTQQDRGCAVLVEVNPFALNEREFLFADWRKYALLTDDDNTLPLLRLSSWRVRQEIGRHGGFDALASAVVRNSSAAFHLGRSVKGGARNRLRRIVIGKDPPPNRPTEAQRLAITRENFRRKVLDTGVDSDVLEALRISARASKQMVLYFPPINGKQVREAVGPECSFWGRYADWRRQMADMFERTGILVFDYTELFQGREDAFLDYGHLSDDGLEELARAMARDLRAHGLIP